MPTSRLKLSSPQCFPHQNAERGGLQHSTAEGTSSTIDRAIHPKRGTPYVSILVTGALMSLLAFVADLRQTVAITSFSILSTHIILHVSAIRLRRKIPELKAFKAPQQPIRLLSSASVGTIDQTMTLILTELSDLGTAMAYYT